MDIMKKTIENLTIAFTINPINIPYMIIRDIININNKDEMIRFDKEIKVDKYKKKIKDSLKKLDLFEEEIKERHKKYILITTLKNYKELSKKVKEDIDELGRMTDEIKKMIIDIDYIVRKYCEDYIEKFMKSDTFIKYKMKYRIYSQSLLKDYPLQNINVNNIIIMVKNLSILLEMYKLSSLDITSSFEKMVKSLIKCKSKESYDSIMKLLIGKVSKSPVNSKSPVKPDPKEVYIRRNGKTWIKGKKHHKDALDIFIKNPTQSKVKTQHEDGGYFVADFSKVGKDSYNYVDESGKSVEIMYITPSDVAFNNRMMDWPDEDDTYKEKQNKDWFWPEFDTSVETKDKTKIIKLSAEEIKLFKKYNLDTSVNLEQLKKNYKKLQIKFHPDKGGDIEEFKYMQSLYENRFT